MAEISLDKVKRVSHRMIITHTDIISVKCPHCGYSEQCQSYDKQQVKDIKDKMRFHIRQCYYQRNRRIYGENDY